LSENFIVLRRNHGGIIMNAHRSLPKASVILVRL